MAAAMCDVNSLTPLPEPEGKKLSPGLTFVSLARDWTVKVGLYNSKSYCQTNTEKNENSPISISSRLPVPQYSFISWGDTFWFPTEARREQNPSRITAELEAAHLQIRGALMRNGVNTGDAGPFQVLNISTLLNAWSSSNISVLHYTPDSSPEPV